MNKKIIRILKNGLTFIKKAIYGVKMGKDSYIGEKTKIVNGKNVNFGERVSIMPYNLIIPHGGAKIIIEDDVEIGMFSRIASKNKVTISKNVITGPNVFIADYNHEYKDIDIPIKNQGSSFVDGAGNKNEIFIGEDSWIGTNVVIVGNVKIGKHVVIGANSVITKDIDDYCVVAGNPFRVIKRYKEETNSWEKV